MGTSSYLRVFGFYFSKSFLQALFQMQAWADLRLSEPGKLPGLSSIFLVFLGVSLG
jgi:hypothetical protein